MKRYLNLLIAACLIVGTIGCTTTRKDPVTGEVIIDPETGQPVKDFDPAKTALLLAPMEGAITTAVIITGRQDPKTASAFRIVQAVVNNCLAEGKNLDRSEIMARLNNIEIAGLSDADKQILIDGIAGTVLNWYDNLMNYVLRQEINKADALPMILDTISRGISLGLLALEPQPE